MLPGPSSTQTVTLIGYKRGGWLLAIITLMIWIFPACTLMIGLAIGVHHYNLKDTGREIFHFVHPMAIGFLIYAAYVAMKNSLKHIATYAIMIVACMASVSIRSPWLFPVLLLIGGLVSNLSSRRIPQIVAKPKKIKWGNAYMFFIIFIIAALLSETARIKHWPVANYFNLFENFYRFGSFTWGGGHALAPLLHEQFIELPQKRHLLPSISHNDFLTGFGIMNSIPGPVFSICAYIGSMSVANLGVTAQIIGGIIASIAIFLPSTLLVFFLFPIYNNLKQHTIIFRSLEGIYSVIIGIMWASSILLIKNTIVHEKDIVIQISIVFITFVILNYKKIPAPIIVLAALLLGLIFK
jgi:chromate transporter